MLDKQQIDFLVNRINFVEEEYDEYDEELAELISKLQSSEE